MFMSLIATFLKLAAVLVWAIHLVVVGWRTYHHKQSPPLTDMMRVGEVLGFTVVGMAMSFRLWHGHFPDIDFGTGFTTAVSLALGSWATSVWLPLKGTPEQTNQRRRTLAMILGLALSIPVGIGLDG